MKSEEIKNLLEKFENACYNYKDIECWSARELQKILGYTKWDNFINVIEKAKNTCKSANLSIPDHFADVGKTLKMPNSAEKQIDDIALTCYACYLVAQNGDSSKNEIAFAQTYFAV